MKLVTRILLGVFLIIGVGFYYLTYGILDNIRTRYLEGVEETMVDQSRIMASFISDEIEKGAFSPEKLHKIFDHTYNSKFTSTIYQLKKTSVDMRVYMTDKSGLIVFDSMRKDPNGTDYSQWIDVSRTLQGKYGARSSREPEKRKNSGSLCGSTYNG
jgi:two-component system sensor histidine kinase CreC